MSVRIGSVAIISEVKVSTVSASSGRTQKRTERPDPSLNHDLLQALSEQLLLRRNIRVARLCTKPLRTLQQERRCERLWQSRAQARDYTGKNHVDL